MELRIVFLYTTYNEADRLINNEADRLINNEAKS